MRFMRVIKYTNFIFLSQVSPKKERKGQNNTMADKKEQEMKIIVFTNLKNGAILKNLFIVNIHPSPTSISQDYEETLFVGRYPDCNITLTHPNIIRFHLQFHSNPSI